MNEADKLIADQVSQVPEQIRQAIEAVPWKSLVKEIAVANELSPEQVTVLERETMFILYGFESSDDYIANLMKEELIGEGAATTIAEAINEKVFKIVMNKIEELERHPAPRVSSTPLTNLPMVEPGEVAHEVPHVESTTNNLQPTTTEQRPATQSMGSKRYDGPDPYREPLV